jgi:hypothetical protein
MIGQIEIQEFATEPCENTPGSARFPKRALRDMARIQTVIESNPGIRPAIAFKEGCRDAILMIPDIREGADSEHLCPKVFGCLLDSGLVTTELVKSYTNGIVYRVTDTTANAISAVHNFA